VAPRSKIDRRAGRCWQSDRRCRRFVRERSSIGRRPSARCHSSSPSLPRVREWAEGPSPRRRWDSGRGSCPDARSGGRSRRRRAADRPAAPLARTSARLRRDEASDTRACNPRSRFPPASG
jgi:hypothetical protein